MSARKTLIKSNGIKVRPVYSPDLGSWRRPATATFVPTDREGNPLSSRVPSRAFDPTGVYVSP